MEPELPSSHGGGASHGPNGPLPNPTPLCAHAAISITHASASCCFFIIGAIFSLSLSRVCAAKKLLLQPQGGFELPGAKTHNHNTPAEN